MRMDANNIKSIAELMKEAMSASPNSYYKAQQPLGEQGDFITSPEISQMFGEMIGIWAIHSFIALGTPLEFNLVELGPGRGLLMRDLLNGTSKQTVFHQALKIHLLDINPILIAEQKKQLLSYAVNWIDKIEDLPPLPTIFIANEFFDALPIKQYIKKNTQWHEVHVMIKEHNATEIIYLDISEEKQQQLNDQHPNTQEDGIVEESTESLKIMQSIACHIKKYKGAAIIIDYGYDIEPDNRTKNQYNSTLQAIKDHKFHPVFEDLGQADLSAHVDFYSLKSVALKQGLKVTGAISQRALLQTLGIDLRLESLTKQNLELKEILEKQHHRLTAKETMGELFKAIIVEY